MKWIMLIGVIVLTTSCCTTADVVEYRQITLARPVVAQPVPVPMVTRVITPVMAPAIVNYVEPVVTTTTVDFY